MRQLLRPGDTSFLERRYRQLLLGACPKAYWPMDDGDAPDTVRDHSGNGYDAPRESNGSTRPIYRQQGPRGPAVFLEGLSNFQTPAGLGINGTTTHYAIVTSSWKASTPSDECLFGKIGGSSGSMQFMSTTVVHYQNVTSYDSGVTYPVGQWNHIISGWDGTNVRIFLNGASILTTAAGSGGGAETAPEIGTYSNRAVLNAGGAGWDGYMQHVAYYEGTAADTVLNDGWAAASARLAGCR